MLAFSGFIAYYAATAATEKKRSVVEVSRCVDIKKCLSRVCSRTGTFYCVPSMALILLVKVQSRVFTAKCSEPQADASNDMGEGSGVAKFLSLRTET